jgi:hypothetical protein
MIFENRLMRRILFGPKKRKNRRVENCTMRAP